MAIDSVLGQINLNTFITPDDFIKSIEKDGINEKPIFLTNGACIKTKVNAPKTTPIAAEYIPTIGAKIKILIMIPKLYREDAIPGIKKWLYDCKIAERKLPIINSISPKIIILVKLESKSN